MKFGILYNTDYYPESNPSGPQVASFGPFGVTMTS